MGTIGQILALEEYYPEKEKKYIDETLRNNSINIVASMLIILWKHDINISRFIYVYKGM